MKGKKKKTRPITLRYNTNSCDSRTRALCKKNLCYLPPFDPRIFTRLIVNHGMSRRRRVDSPRSRCIVSGKSAIAIPSTAVKAHEKEGLRYQSEYIKLRVTRRNSAINSVTRSARLLLRKPVLPNSVHDPVSLTRRLRAEF